MTASERRHIPALDGLRGIAILLVVSHGFDVVKTRNGIGHDVDLALDVGWIGVQLFFVLSGFLITGILLDTREARGYYRNFLVRRVLRIFPLYYGVLFVAYAVLPNLVTLQADYGQHQIWLWTYLGNFAEPLGRGEPAFPHFWSLAVEEQFYIVWPLVVYVAGRRGTAVVAGALALAAIAARLYVRDRWGSMAAYMFTPCRMDALAIGAVVAALVRGDRVRRLVADQRPLAVALVGCAVVLGGAIWGHLLRAGPVMQTAGYTLIALGFALVLVASLSPQGVPARVLGGRPLRMIGTYSYGMYVFYAPLHLYVGLPVLAKLVPSPGVAAGLVYALVLVAVTFGLAAASYHVYERRFLALKPKLAPVGSPNI